MNTIASNELSALSNTEKCQVMKMIIKGQVKYAANGGNAMNQPICANCKSPTDHAPCGCHICKDCCKLCYKLKERCRHIKDTLSEKEGQEFD